MSFEIRNNLRNIDRCVLSQILKNNVGIFTQDELIDILKDKLRDINPNDLAYITPLPKNNKVQKNTYNFANAISLLEQNQVKIDWTALSSNINAISLLEQNQVKIDVCRELLEDRDNVLSELKAIQFDNVHSESIGMINGTDEITWVRSMRDR